MAEIIKLSDKLDTVGYCGNCGNEFFMLLLDDNENVTCLRCGDGITVGCGERVDLDPIIVECEIK